LPSQDGPETPVVKTATDKETDESKKPKTDDYAARLAATEKSLAAMMLMITKLAKANQAVLDSKKPSPAETAVDKLAILGKISSGDETKRPVSSGKSASGSNNLLAALKERVSVEQKGKTSTVPKVTVSQTKSKSNNAFVDAFGDVGSDRSDDEDALSNDESDGTDDSNLLDHNPDHPETFRQDMLQELAQRVGKKHPNSVSYVKSFLHDNADREHKVSNNWQRQLEFLAECVDVACQDLKRNPMDCPLTSMLICRLVGILLSVEAGNDYEILDCVSSIAIHGKDAQRSDRVANRLRKEKKKKALLSPSRSNANTSNSTSSRGRGRGRGRGRNGNGGYGRSDWGGGYSDFGQYLDSDGQNRGRGRGGRGRGNHNKRGGKSSTDTASNNTSRTAPTGGGTQTG
jgi:hypothetical protein